MTANPEQDEYWNGEPGDRWRSMADETDTVFGPLTTSAIDIAAPAAGERVLDIGCGCGGTTLQLAHRVGPSGSVTGLDLSRTMLDHARERASERGIGNVRWIAGDATTVDLAPGSYDVLFSQFGVMFFTDPVATFAHLRGALAPHGRVLFRCWQSNEKNAFFRIPATAAKPYVADGTPPVPGVPGPLAFADPERVRDILTRAGFTGITIEPEQTLVPLGRDLAEAVHFTSRIGAAARVLEDAKPAERPLALAAIRDALQPFASADGVLLGTGTWIVQARPAPH